jgi:predicted P-loop ATPase
MRSNRGRDSAPIDFVGLAKALANRSREFCERWLPYGHERNRRWYVGDFDGGAGESANVNLDTGQWIDNAAPQEDVGGDLISLYARIHGLANGKAARELMDWLGWAHDDVQAPVREAPAKAADAAEPAPAGKEGRWQPIAPVPPKCPRPQSFRWGYYDKKGGRRIELDAVKVWPYEFEGEFYGYVARFERVNSEGELVKDTLPLTWCVDTSDERGHHRWHWKQWSAPRPLYVPATILSADKSLPVVVVEGEKCAEAGHQLLGHEFDFVSWPGGCKAHQLAHWGWLMGRTVILWPDCDAQRKRLSKAERDAGIEPATKPILPAHEQPGMAAMVKIGTHLVREQACSVSLCQIPAPGAVPDGWDIADAIAAGWSADQVRDFLRGAVAFVPPDEAPAHAEGSTPPAGNGSSGGGDGKGAGEPSKPRDPWWRDFLIESEKGGVKPVRENVVLALDGYPEMGIPGIKQAQGVIAFNEFTNNVVKLKPTPWGTPAGEWLEADELLMGEWLALKHCLPSMSRATLEEAVLMVATRHSFHPVREEFESYRGTWDQEKRLNTLLARVCLVEGEHDQQLLDYLARVGTWMVMAIVARVLRPGCKFDYMPIFEGPQGWGKSTLAKVLGGDYFADTGLVLGEKDSYQNLQGVLVYEWGELDSLNKADVQKVKLFIASEKDRFRASFDRRPRDYPRQVVFIGTTNEDHYLTDPTGNRRFWPVRVTKPVDIAYLREHRQQLFAEALAYLDAGNRFHPTLKEQRELFEPQQQQREVGSAIEDALRRFLYDEQQKVPHGGLNGSLINEIECQELLQRIGFTVDKQTAQIRKQCGQAMKRMGWPLVKSTRVLGGKRPWVYRRPSEDAAAAQPGVAETARSSAGAGNGNGSPESHVTTEADDVCPF